MITKPLLAYTDLFGPRVARSIAMMSATMPSIRLARFWAAEAALKAQLGTLASAPVRF